MSRKYMRPACLPTMYVGGTPSLSDDGWEVGQSLGALFTGFDITDELCRWRNLKHCNLTTSAFPDFLLQPFRKPKRVRTAFSPTQLLKLEHAFEGNHYVVGAERKTLAQQLGLTETQVRPMVENCFRFRLEKHFHMKIALT